METQTHTLWAKYHTELLIYSFRLIWIPTLTICLMTVNLSSTRTKQNRKTEQYHYLTVKTPLQLITITCFWTQRPVLTLGTMTISCRHALHTTANKHTRKRNMFSLHYCDKTDKPLLKSSNLVNMFSNWTTESKDHTLINNARLLPKPLHWQVWKVVPSYFLRNYNLFYNMCW